MFMIFEVKRRRDKSYFYTGENEHLGKVSVRVGLLNYLSSTQTLVKDLLAHITRPQAG